MAGHCVSMPDVLVHDVGVCSVGIHLRRRAPRSTHYMGMHCMGVNCMSMLGIGMHKRLLFSSCVNLWYAASWRKKHRFCY